MVVQVIGLVRREEIMGMIRIFQLDLEQNPTLARRVVCVVISCFSFKKEMMTVLYSMMHFRVKYTNTNVSILMQPSGGGHSAEDSVDVKNNVFIFHLYLLSF